MSHNIFLDCGFYDGIALKKWIEAGVVDNTWSIYVFEPRPDFDIQARLDRLGVSNAQVIKKAAWLFDGSTAFDMSGHENAGYLASTRRDADPNDILVETIDFSDFVSHLTNPQIICSMDIEGAEYELLEKMLDEGTIDKIKVLDIEFHHRFMNAYTADDSRKLIERLEARGVDVRLKVDLE